MIILFIAIIIIFILLSISSINIDNKNDVKINAKETNKQNILKLKNETKKLIDEAIIIFK